MSNKSKRKEALGVKNYIRYVKQRVKILRLKGINVSDNQINYFDALNKSIDVYMSEHKLFVKYLIGKIKYEEVKTILGISDRQVFRYLSRQRKLLIEYITAKEIELFAKFPYEEENFIMENENER